MNAIFKSAVSLMAAAAMCIMSLPLPAIAESYGDYEYVLNADGETATITGFSDAHTDAGENLSIPGSLGGYDVAAIAEGAFRDNTAITKVSFPSSLTEVGSFAFAGCTALESIAIPEDAVLTVEDKAFSGCTALTGITVQEGVMLDAYAFEGCTAMTTFAVYNPECGLGAGGGGDPEMVQVYGYDNSAAQADAEQYGYNFINFGPAPQITWALDGDVLTFSGEGAMRNYSVSLNIPWQKQYGKTAVRLVVAPGITKIGSAAFTYMSVLESVTIADTVKEIGDYAFNYDKVLREVNIPEGVEKVGSGAFFECYGLEEITFPASVQSVDRSALYECESLKSVTFLNPDCKIGDSASTIYNYKDENNAYVYEGVIRGYAGSTAQAYAERYGYTFVEIDGSSIETTPRESTTETPATTTEMTTTETATEMTTTETTTEMTTTETTTEMAATETTTETTTETVVPEQKKGDVSGDETIDSEDASLVLVAAASLGLDKPSGLSAAAEKSADVNGDGEVNTVDASIILTYAAAQGLSNTPLDLADFIPKA